MFTLHNTDGAARRGTLTTAHGDVQTPAFCNVGTQAAIKGGLSAFDLEAVGCQVELSNTYHLHLRPGEELIRNLGGLHAFMRWNKPILTDSGGFQVFSLAKMRKITEDGITFASHIDGRKIFLTPERCIGIQLALGSDIIMALDECIENPAPRDYVERSVDRTTRWLCRACAAKDNQDEGGRVRLPQLSTSPNCQLSTVNDPLLWGINQGGIYPDIRIRHMQDIAALDLPGYAIGGLAVGESAEEMYHILDVVTPHMPAQKPRYLMGVGTPGNIIEAVARGVDWFDCVLPARNARHGRLYTHNGYLTLRNNRYKDDPRPVEEGCGCPLCTSFSRAYLRHLFIAKEMLAMRLAVLHNLWFYNHLMQEIRDAIAAGTFDAFRRQYAVKLDKGIDD